MFPMQRGAAVHSGCRVRFGSLGAAAPPIALISCHRCLGKRGMMLMGGEGVAEAALMAGDFSDLSNCFHNVSKTIFLRDIISMKFLVLNAKTLCYHINIEKSCF